MPSLEGATAWLNSEPLPRSKLRGKVVVVQFFSYSCIEWLGTFPTVKTWDEQYRTRGLIVIGVHTPEYSFEHDVENVRRAAEGLSLNYPIAIDNHRGVWNAFKNQYSPGLYLVDSKGRIRHHQFGADGYEESERLIQELLREAGASVRSLQVPAAPRAERP